MIDDQCRITTNEARVYPRLTHASRKMQKKDVRKKGDEANVEGSVVKLMIPMF